MARVYAADLLTLPSRTKRDNSRYNNKRNQASSSQRQSDPFWEPSKQIYSLIFEQFAFYEEALKAFYAIAEKNRRWCKKDFSSVSCLVGISVTQSQGAIRRSEANGRPGHPNNVIEGRAEKPHIHMVVYGDMAATYVQMFKAKYNTKAGWTAALSKKMGSMKYISYVYNQSNLIRASGTFDFKPYCAPYNKEYPSEEGRMCRNNHRKYKRLPDQALFPLRH